MVYEDIDGDGHQDIFSGEMGIADWPVDLSWNGQVIASLVSGPDGSFIFPNLGNSTYSVCLGADPQGRNYLIKQPADGSRCYTFTFNSQFMTWSVNNYGVMFQ